MPKITFLGAGSTVFARTVLGDALVTQALANSEIALYDIDAVRLRESRLMLDTLNKNVNKGKAKIRSYCGVEKRKAALKNADYIVNAIQVGGYEPCTVIDFEIPKKYGLRQTIADTLGIGGIFRGLRTAHVMLDVARDIEAVCPEAWLLNYTNPMSIVSGVMLHGTGVKTVGLCHSVQCCASGLIRHLKMKSKVKDLRWSIAGINHMGWLLECKDGKKDLYPEIKKRAAVLNERARKPRGKKHYDMVRFELMKHFGYYVTESSEHNAEYSPYWIKSQFPGLIEEFNIPLDEYPRRCVNQIAGWKKEAEEVVHNKKLTHKRSMEYGSHIMEAMETGNAITIGGNVLNTGLITNLPSKAIVEVACLVDKNGVQGTFVGDLPEQCAALNRTNINVHLLTINAALTRSKESLYHAAFMDPHTSAELPLDKIRSLCDDLIRAHRGWLPRYR